MIFELTLKYPNTNDVVHISFEVDKNLMNLNPAVGIHALAYFKASRIHCRDYIDWTFVSLYDKHGVEVVEGYEDIIK